MQASGNRVPTKTQKSRARSVCVAIVESDPLRIAGFQSIVDTRKGLGVSFFTLTELTQALQSIDVALLRWTDVQSLAADITLIKQGRTDLAILVMAPRTDDAIVMDALSLGARGVIDEVSFRANHAEAISVVANGLVWAPRRAIARFIERHNVPVQPEEARKVTNRERDILELLMSGRSNREIAYPLGITTRTVKSHLCTLMRKLGVRNRIELAAYILGHPELNAKVPRI